MCVIIIKQKQDKIAMQTLQNASIVNPHGLGVTWLDTWKTDYLQSDEYQVLHTERPFIAHFRYKTIGKVCKENTHPFVCGDNKDELLMMNGTAHAYGDHNMTDTQHIANVLGDIPRSDWKSFLSKFTTVRFVSINTKNKSFQIYNRDLFTYKDGVWYSKTNIFGEHTVAVYGTLKRGHHNYSAYLKGNSVCIGSAVTQSKYPLIVNGLPYLSPKKGVGHHVEVDVFKVDDETLADLDRLENHPNWYKRKQVPVVLDHNRQIVYAWVYFNDVQIKGMRLHQSYESRLQQSLFKDDCYEIADINVPDDSEVMCPDCYGDVEYDHFYYYYCNRCEEWHSENDIMDIDDMTERLLTNNKS